MTLYYTYLYFLTAALGACVGSFLNVVIYRLPRESFLARSRSYCPACEITLQWRDIIPLLSYVLLRGRCRYCGAQIPLRYPAVELSCALLALLCLERFGPAPQAALAFGIMSILLAVTLIDIDTMRIPNALILALIPFAICAPIINDIALMQRIAGFFTISLPMLLLTLIIQDAFGGGDIKLIAVCGLILGWRHVLLAFFIAVLTGGSYAAYLLISGRSKRGEHIAFGPYLCLGIASALLWGTEIIQLYLDLFFRRAW